MEQLELSFCVQVKAKGPKEEQVNAITGFSSQIMSEYHNFKESMNISMSTLSIEILVFLMTFAHLFICLCLEV